MPNKMADTGGKREEFPAVFITYHNIIREMKIKNSH